jgi:signal peptidase I
MNQEPVATINPENIDPAPLLQNNQPAPDDISRDTSNIVGLNQSYTSPGFIFTVIGIVLLYVVAFGITTVKLYKEYSTDMIPTIKQGQRVIAGSSKNLKINDIIIFNQSIGSYDTYAKSESVQEIERVVALPGDRVKIYEGKLTVFNSSNPNGFNPDSLDGLSGQITNGNISMIVPKGDVFVLGDNRSDSQGTIELNPVPIKNILGKVAHIL